MKILHIITSLELGGAERLLSELAPYQKNRGHEVKVLILCDKGAVFKKELKERGIEVIVSPKNSIKAIGNIFFIASEIKKGAYDIVHVHLVHAQYWTRFAMILAGRKGKYITTEHSTSNRRRKSTLMRVLDKFIFSGYDRIVSISEATEKSLKEWLKRDDKAFKIIYNGIDIEEFKKASPLKKEDLGLKTEDIVLMMVSRFHESKNQKGVVDALTWLPAKYKLVFVGDGRLETDVKNYCQEKNLINRVKFLGMRKDIPKLLKTADIIIQYSFFEGFGITTLEGMAAGKPVIASNVPGLKQVVEGAGLLVDIDDSKQLAKEIMTLRNIELYNEIVKKCLARSENYTIRWCGENYLKLYMEELK